MRYRAREFARVIEAGPHPDENFYRLQVYGVASTKHLNITREELDAIAKLLDTED